MSSSLSHSSSLEQLLALNEQIVLLSRAGVPLEQGLLQTADELSGRSRELAGTLATELASGKSLPQVLKEHPKYFPPLYVAVTEAGLKTGRLPAAMQSMAASLQRVAELQRNTSYALVYPLLVLTAAYIAFLFSLMQIVPGWIVVYRDFYPREPLVPRALNTLIDTMQWWALVPPLIVVLLLWLRSRRGGARAASAHGWFPSMRRWLANLRVASFTEILTLLVEQQLPLDEALILAGDASGDRTIAAAARRLAEWIQQGGHGAPPDTSPGIPLILTWLLISDVQQGPLPERLRRHSDWLQRHVAAESARMEGLLPILMTVGIGGTAVIFYGMWILGLPYYFLFKIAG